MTLTAIFGSRSPYTTNWLELEYLEAEPPTELLAALAAIGWTQGPFPQLPPLNGVCHVELSKPGSDLFQCWTAAEERANMSQVRRLLRRFGFMAVPIHKYTMAELI